MSEKQTEPALSDDDRIHLDRAIAEIEKRIQLKKIINRSDAVNELWRERLYLGETVQKCAAVFQRYQLELDAEGMEPEDREGVQAINEAFNMMRQVALELQ